MLKGENRQAILSRVIFGSIWGAFETHHGLGAFARGIESFSAALRESGEEKVRCAVELGRHIRLIGVSQGEPLPPGRWITWQSLTTAALNLRQRALRGEELGDLNSIISTLQQEGRLVYYVSPLRKRNCD